MDSAFKSVFKRVEKGLPLSERELVIFVRGLSKVNTPVVHEKENHTVIWYDCDEGKSSLLHVEAKDGVDALQKTKNRRPNYVNVSVYPTLLPKSLKLVPESIRQQIQ